MTRSRRLSMLGLAAGLTFSMVACAPPSPVAPETSQAPTSAAGAEQTLVFWSLSDITWLQPAIDRFESDYPSVTVDYVQVPTDQFKTKIRVGLGTDSGPDVFFTWAGTNTAEYVNAGLVEPLDDVVASNGLADVFGAGVMGQGTYGGQQYALPSAVEASMIWYNTEIFSQLNLEPPTTWNEFLDVVAKVKDADLIPIAMANKGQWPGAHWWSEFVTLSCGADFIQQAALGVDGFSFADPCVAEGHARLQELVKAGAFNEGFNGLDYDAGESRQLFWSGQAAMNHMGNWTITAAKDEAPEMLPKMDFFTLPAWDGAKGTTDMMTGGISPMFAVSSSAKDKEIAKRFIVYLIDAESSKAAAEAGRVPVYQGTPIADPLVQKVADAINNAPSIAPWPDQALQPEAATVMLTQSQALFGLETTPEEAAQQIEATNAQVAGA